MVSRRCIRLSTVLALLTPPTTAPDRASCSPKLPIWRQLIIVVDLSAAGSLASAFMPPGLAHCWQSTASQLLTVNYKPGSTGALSRLPHQSAYLSGHSGGWQLLVIIFSVAFQGPVHISQALRTAGTECRQAGSYVADRQKQTTLSSCPESKDYRPPGWPSWRQAAPHHHRPHRQRGARPRRQAPHTARTARRPCPPTSAPC